MSLLKQNNVYRKVVSMGGAVGQMGRNFKGISFSFKIAPALAATNLESYITGAINTPARLS